jgi:hypothetical protein
MGVVCFSAVYLQSDNSCLSNVAFVCAADYYGRALAHTCYPLHDAFQQTGHENLSPCLLMQSEYNGILRAQIGFKTVVTVNPGMGMNAFSSAHEPLMCQKLCVFYYNMVTMTTNK